MKFNSSQIFEAHPSNSLSKFLLTPDFASFQLVPKYISKVKVLSKYITLKQLFPWKMGAKGEVFLIAVI